MKDFCVQLKAAGLNGWIIQTEESLTKVRECLDIVETEEKDLGRVYEGGAKQQWEVGFQDGVGQVREHVEKMGKLILAVNETAQDLVRLELKMVGMANDLRV